MSASEPVSTSVLSGNGSYMHCRHCLAIRDVAMYSPSGILGGCMAFLNHGNVGASSYM